MINKTLTKHRMKKLLNISTAFMLISFAFLQSGCLKQFANDQFPDVTANSETINGIVKYKNTDPSGTKLDEWHFGAAVIKAILGGNVVLASAPLETDGTFKLILPATVGGIYFSKLADIAYQQGGTIKATPAEIRFLGTIQFKVEYTDNDKAKSIFVNLSTLKTDLSVNRSYYYNFYDLDGTFTGIGTSGNKFNWTFTKGWGIVESFITNTTSNAFDSRSVTSAPVEAIWVN
jgi:hypothetical protein